MAGGLAEVTFVFDPIARLPDFFVMRSGTILIWED